MNFEIDDKSVFSMDTGENLDSKKHTIFLLHGSGQSHVVWSLTTQFLSDQNNNLNFELENKRNIDRKTLNLIRNKEISAIIS